MLLCHVRIFIVSRILFWNFFYKGLRQKIKRKEKQKIFQKKIAKKARETIKTILDIQM